MSYKIIMRTNSIVYFLLLLFCIYIFGCSTKTIKLKTYIDYKSKDSSYWKQKKRVFRISVPNGFQKQTILGDHETEIQLVYQDSSIIYISDELKSGSYSNWKNLESITSKNFDYLYKDTVINEGITKTGFWKEMKLKYIIIGYLNMPEDKKAVFEKSLKSIK